MIVSDIAVFVLKRDIKLQPTILLMRTINASSLKLQAGALPDAQSTASKH